MTMTSRPPKLSPEEAADVRELFEAGQDARTASEEMTAARNAGWIELYARGVGATEIARAAGCDRVTVARVLSAHRSIGRANASDHRHDTTH